MLRRSLLVVGVLVLTAAPVAAGGGGCHSPQTDANGTAVEMSYFCFSPTVVRIAPGETVTWENLDSVDHNVYSSGFGTETLRGGMSGSVTFDESGVFPYVCIFHPGMMGTVVVGDAVTPPSAAIETIKAAVAEAPSDDGVEQRLAAVEASLLTLPAESGQQPSWPGLAVGLLAGLALGVLGSRLPHWGRWPLDSRSMTETTEASVVEFLRRFEAGQATKSFADVADMIHPDALGSTTGTSAATMPQGASSRRLGRTRSITRSTH
ncbi:MAG: hypothetical protein V3R84_08815 [Acidimicrobiia bacterium]